MAGKKYAVVRDNIFLKNERQSSSSTVTAARNGKRLNMIEKLPRNLLASPLGDSAFPSYK